MPVQRDAQVQGWVLAEAGRSVQPVCTRVAEGCPASHPKDCGTTCVASDGACALSPLSSEAVARTLLGPDFDSGLKAAQAAADEPARVAALETLIVQSAPEAHRRLQARMADRLGRYLQARGYSPEAATAYAGTVWGAVCKRLTLFAAVAAAPALRSAAEVIEASALAEVPQALGNPSCDAAPLPPHIVTILGPHGKYLVAERDGRLNVDRSEAKEWEHFELTEYADGRVSLQSFHGRFVVAEKNGQARANRKEVSDWEKFKVTYHGDGTISFLGHHGKYLVAEPRGQANADRKEPDAWEKFRLIPAGSTAAR